MENRSSIKIGACGICCETCGLYVKGICSGCDKSEKGVKFLKSIDANCPVLECAVKKRIDVCSRDCGKFPCDNFAGWPLSEEWLDMYKSRQKGE